MIYAHEDTGRDIDIRAILSVLRRQSRVIFYTFFLVFGMAGAFLLLAKPHFTASALIIVDPETKNLLEPGRSGSGNASTDNARVDSEVEILRSNAVALAVIERENLIDDAQFAPQPGLTSKLAGAVGIAHASSQTRETQSSRVLANFSKAVTVRRKGLTYLISASVSAEDAKQSADLANALAETYIQNQLTAKINASLSARDVLQVQIEESRQALKTYETRFDQLFTDNAARAAFAGDPAAARLRDRLLGLNEQRGAIEALRISLSEELERGNWSAIAEGLDNGQLADLIAGRDGLLAPDAAAEMKLDSEELLAELTRIEDLLETQSVTGIDALSGQIQLLDRESAEARQELRQKILATDIPADLLTSLYGLQQEANIARSQYENLLARMHDLETQARIQIADSRIVSPALAPVSPAFPNKGLVMLVALAAASSLGVGLAFLNEYYIGGITAPTQLAEILQVPMAASIPLSPETNNAALSVADKVIDTPLSVYSESIRKLRAAIDQTLTVPLAEKTQTGGKIILVTSSFADEGKTTTALSLARTYALAGKKTLLIDADLRKPALHKHLGFAPQVGFLDYLRDPDGNEISSGFYARDPGSPLALIMGANRAVGATDQMLNTATFEALMDQARAVYDITIVDSPPLLPVVDARYIAHHADAVALVVKWASTGQSDLRTAAQPLRLAMQPGAALIPVLTQSESQRADGGYDTYYGQYSVAG